MKMKAVRFGDATVVGHVPLSWHYTDKEAGLIWYQQRELKAIKKNSRLVASVILASIESDEKGVEINPLSIPQNRQQENLNRWCRHVPAGRGLERWVYSDYSTQCQNARYQHCYTVLIAQSALQGQANTNDQIRIVSEAGSHKARAFAVMMGAADEYAANRPSSTLSFCQGTNCSYRSVPKRLINSPAMPKKWCIFSGFARSHSNSPPSA
jgi:hypothetical protein